MNERCNLKALEVEIDGKEWKQITFFLIPIRY